MGPNDNSFHGSCIWLLILLLLLHFVEHLDSHFQLYQNVNSGLSIELIPLIRELVKVDVRVEL
jgi:hypothetical protein